MAIRTYCDGSGKPGDPNCKVLTLAGVGLKDTALPEFEALWRLSIQAEIRLRSNGFLMRGDEVRRNEAK